jgi:glucose/arabinose dehydrogenase
MTTLLASLSLAAGLATANMPAPPKVDPPEPQMAPSSPVGPSSCYRTVVLATGLNHPWALALLPDGDMLITEKFGGVRVWRNGALDPDRLAGGPAALQDLDGGLLDIALDPEFRRNRFVYIAFSEGAKDANQTAVWKARYDGRKLVGGKVIFRAQPAKAGSHHFGARLLFLPDKTFLLTLGEGFTYRDKAQDLGGDLGKIVRLDRNGQPPRDNPFVGHANVRPEIYAYGVRNPQGLLRDPRDGTIWEHEHGPKGGDEINIVRPGANYGWPKTTYGIDYSGAIISDLRTAPGIDSPILVWVPSIAPSGFALYLGDRFPAWKGDFFVGALANRSLFRVRLRQGRLIEEEELLKDRKARIRDVRALADGDLYVLTDEPDGKLLRLEPSPDCANPSR